MSSTFDTDEVAHTSESTKRKLSCGENAKLNERSSSTSDSEDFNHDPDQDANTNPCKKAKADTGTNTDEDKIQNFEAESEHAIFSTDLVLEEIFSNLGSKELLNCRQVNKKFKACTSPFIRKLSLKIEFKYSWSDEAYISQRFHESGVPGDLKNNFRLERLTNFLDSVTDFPFTQYSFTNGTLTNPSLQDFLSRHGKSVKDLSIDLFSPPFHHINPAGEPVPVPPPTLSSLRHLLVEQVPNVITLQLSKPPPQWNTDLRLEQKLFSRSESLKRDDEDRDGNEVCLNNLKSLDLDRFPRAVSEEILRAACYLREIISCEDLLPVLKADKFHLLKSLSWAPTPRDVEKCEQFLPSTYKSGSQMFHFLILLSAIPFNPQLWFKLARVINFVLKESSQTLSAFGFGTSLSFLENHIIIPQLPNLKTLTIGIGVQPDFILNHDPNQQQQQQLALANFALGGGPSRKCFPTGLQLASQFPHLSAVKISIGMATEFESWDTYFENYAPVPTVRYFNWGRTRFFPMGWMLHFSRIFPNIEALEINAKFFNVLDAAINGLWSFQKLQDLNFYVSLSIAQNLYPSLDSAFTGFSEATCESLKDSEEIDDVARVEDLRENSSLVGLQDLELLWMTFVDEDTDPRADYPQIISNVATRYAFQMCPKLKIACGYCAVNEENKEKLKNALSPFLEANN